MYRDFSVSSCSIRIENFRNINYTLHIKKLYISFTSEINVAETI